MDPSSSNNQSRPSLPIDVILLVIDSLIPSNPNAILPPSDERTKLFLALTRVCKPISPFAEKLLYRFCTYVNSLRSASSLNRRLSNLPAGDSRRPTSLFIGLYLNPKNDLYPCPWPSYITSGYSANATWDDQSYANTVARLLVNVAPTLKRLVIDMPLGALHPKQYILNDQFRNGFESLSNLEEFVAIGTDFSFPRRRGIEEEPIWATRWPRLRCLSLHDPVMDEEAKIWGQIVRKEHLDTVVFSWYSDHSFHRFNVGDVKAGWLAAIDAHGKDKGNNREPNPYALVIVDHDCYPQSDFHKDSRVHAEYVDVGVPLESPLRRLEKTAITLRWIKQKALNGTLWDAADSKMVNSLGYKLI